MRAITMTTTVVAVLLIASAGAHAQQCTRNHELYRIVPQYRAVMLDGGEIKRVMFVDSKDERLSTWKPWHNITFCPDENKMINTTINSVATLLSKFGGYPCEPFLISNAIDRSLQHAWDYANKPDGDPRLFLSEAKSQLGWYNVVCTDHDENWFEKEDLKSFLYAAASLTSVNMAIEDPVNEGTYKARAAKYEEWSKALYAAESQKSLPTRVWQRFFAPN
jgi:hypothetical protein